MWKAPKETKDNWQWGPHITTVQLTPSSHLTMQAQSRAMYLSFLYIVQDISILIHGLALHKVLT
jgi:hypothetical protein